MVMLWLWLLITHITNKNSLCEAYIDSNSQGEEKKGSLYLKSAAASGSQVKFIKV